MLFIHASANLWPALVIAKVFGINAPKSFKFIFFPYALSRQQKACDYCVLQNQSTLLCPLKIYLIDFSSHHTLPFIPFPFAKP